MRCPVGFVTPRQGGKLFHCLIQENVMKTRAVLVEGVKNLVSH